MIRQLRCQHYNVFYVTRHDNLHAKAGNLNHAIKTTHSDLIVTFDADFVARPNTLQRLIPYYYVWNPQTELYEFNESLAVVQTPQHYRNLSPYDSDPLDQRSSFFIDAILPGKDYWNASTMVGTTNLLNRAAITEIGLYPYHSIKEDTAMSLAVYSKGYRTYYVNESLASGLSCTSLWSNLGQRARWLKGDYQILFNREKSPLLVKGLTFVQRLLYLHIAFSRVISVINFMFDIGLLLLLLLSIPPLDVTDPIKFISFLGMYLLMDMVSRFVIYVGGRGRDKSESGSNAFEAIFRYTAVKGLFLALFMGQKIQFKVTEKQTTASTNTNRSSFAVQINDVGEADNKNGASGSSPASLDIAKENETDIFPVDPDATRSATPELNAKCSVDNVEPTGSERRVRFKSDDISEDKNSKRLSTISRISSVARSSLLSGTVGDDVEDLDKEDFLRKSYFKQTKEDRALHHQNVLKNLKRVWFIIVWFFILSFAVIWAFIYPPLGAVGFTSSASVTQGRTLSRESALLQISLAIGFGVISLFPHMLAIFLCFVPYTMQWEMTDLVHGRCDQFVQHPRTGRLFVPLSYISLLPVMKIMIMVGSLGALVLFVSKG